MTYGWKLSAAILALIVIRLLSERYDWLPRRMRWRVRIRHSAIAWRLLPDVARLMRAELCRRWRRAEGSAADVVLDGVRVSLLMAALAVAIAARAACWCDPWPAVRLRRWWRPVRV